MIGFVNGCDSFGDTALFLIIYCILQALYVSGKRLKKRAPSFCNSMKMQKKWYTDELLSSSACPLGITTAIPLFFESSMRSVQTKTPKLATARFIYLDVL